MNDINNVDYLNVKIKKEKLTPPRELTKNNDKNNEIVINSNNNTNINSAAAIVDNDKKQIEPVKSSNEILAELFKVFNAPPPEIIINKNENSGKVVKTKKHKDKKHKKRSSADGKKSKDKDYDKLLTSKKVKKKKRNKDEDKKHQRHNSNHQEPAVSSELVELDEEHHAKDDDHINKKKKRHHHHKEHKKKRKKYDDNDKLINKKELNISNRNSKEKVNNKDTTESENVTSSSVKTSQKNSISKPIIEPEVTKGTTSETTVSSADTTSATTVSTNTATTTVTATTTTTNTTTKPNKIIIKCLKNTTIFDASERLAEEKLLNKYSKNESDNDSNNDDDDGNDGKNSFNGDNNSDKASDSLSSILSLSDEETYLNEAYNNSKRLAAAAAASGQSSTRLNDSAITNDQSSNYDNYYYSGHNNGCDRSDRYRYSKSYRSKSGERDNYRSSYRSERSRVTDYYDVKKGRWSGEGSSSRRRKSRSRSYSRSRSRSRSSDCYIDKKKLLDIARKNAINMLKNGTLPGTQNMGADDKEKVLAKMKYNGKTIEELTEYCKKLSNGEKLIELSDVSDGDDSDHDKDGNQRVFNHPFILKDRGPIVMNIKNSTPITPRTAEQTKALLMQYPVSSGQDHRRNENEWIPVLPAKKTEPTIQTVTKQVSKVTPTTSIQQKPINVQNLPPITYPLMSQKTNVQPPITQQQKLQHQQEQQHQQQHMTPLPAPPQIPQVLMTLTQPQATVPTGEHLTQHQQQLPLPKSSSIFLDNQNQVFPDSSMGANLDVSTIISQRLNAMRKLQENPQDPDAIKLLFDTQKDMSAWATSKFTPGQFIGSTGANILSAKELSAGYQPWAKKDQFTSTTPLSGGMGMHLLQKMGWRPGEGLGKDKSGSLQPLLLEVKLDKKGLVAYEENSNKRKSKKQQGNNTNNNCNNSNNLLNNNNNNNLLNNNNSNNLLNTNTNIISSNINIKNINNNNHNNVKNNNSNNNGTHQILNNNLPPTVNIIPAVTNPKILNTTNEKPLLNNNNNSTGTNLIGSNANSTNNCNLNGNNSINNNNNYKINNNQMNNNTNGNNELMTMPLGHVTIIPNNGNINMNALEEKHPVSLLGELAAKRKWGLPYYEVVLESGPGHSKQFMFKVTVNGIQYQPKAPSNNKKEAKATAAKVCLQHMGILNS